MRLPIEQLFVKALKAKGIKRVVEVGPGRAGLIGNFVHLFDEAGCKMYAIGGEATVSGVRQIRGFAGHLKGSAPANFDLVIAQNVFSMGGHGDPSRRGKSNAIENATNGTLDMIKRLSNNKNAAIVLTEFYDLLLVDRKQIEPHAKVLVWKQFQTMSGFTIRDPEFIESELQLGVITHEEARVIREAPNLIVLQKKPIPKRTK